MVWVVELLLLTLWPVDVLLKVPTHVNPLMVTVIDCITKVTVSARTVTVAVCPNPSPWAATCTLVVAAKEVPAQIMNRVSSFIYLYPMSTIMADAVALVVSVFP